MRGKLRVLGFVLGILLLAALVGLGVARAFLRGGNDFAVFYEAWRLVSIGEGIQVYRQSPDRFLYSPAFAWVLSPLGFLPKMWALGVWCFLKVFLLGLLLNKTAAFLRVGNYWLNYLLSIWGVVFLARPLLIDLEYGQVNLLVLCICAIGLLRHFEPRPNAFFDRFQWVLLTFCAFAKLFPLPLLVVPWVVVRGVSPLKLKYERQAILLGAALVVLLPFLFEGWGGGIQLYLDWKKAILDRGLPLESHNQSFIALMNHYLSGDPTHVLSEGSREIQLGFSHLTTEQMGLVSLFWSLFAEGVLLGWILCGALHNSFKWISVTLALLIVPSHLIWKPYFVMGIPLSILAAAWTVKSGSWLRYGLLGLICIGINFTGFDFVGHQVGAYFEAASILLLMHLAMTGLVLYGDS